MRKIVFTLLVSTTLVFPPKARAANEWQLIKAVLDLIIVVVRFAEQSDYEKKKDKEEADSILNKSDFAI